MRNLVCTAVLAASLLIVGAAVAQPRLSDRESNLDATIHQHLADRSLNPGEGHRLLDHLARIRADEAVMIRNNHGAPLNDGQRHDIGVQLDQMANQVSRDVVMH